MRPGVPSKAGQTRGAQPWIPTQKMHHYIQGLAFCLSLKRARTKSKNKGQELGQELLQPRLSVRTPRLKHSLHRHFSQRVKLDVIAKRAASPMQCHSPLMDRLFSRKTLPLAHWTRDTCVVNLFTGRDELHHSEIKFHFVN